jgi:cell division septation protein DedD
MYSEAKFNLGDHEEARKGYNIVIKLFPDSHECEIAQARIDTLHAQAAGTPSVRRVQPQSEQVISNPIAPSGASLPTKDIWKEVVSQNGDRSWVAVDPGTPPREPTGPRDVPALRGKEGQPQSEPSTPVAAAPPDIQPPPENMEEKVRMKDNGRSAISIIPETPPERVLDRQNIPARKQRQGLTPAAQEKPATVMSAAPQPLERSAEVASAKGKKESPLLTEEADLRYSVQVGFFRDEKNALALADKLKKKGYDAHLRKHVRADRKVFFRVLVGHFNEEINAVEHAGAIRQKEGLNSIIFDKAR